jgi:hypothetical protein
LFAREHTSQGWRGEGERSTATWQIWQGLKMAIEVQLLALSYVTRNNNRTIVYRTIVTDSQFPKFLFPPRLINKWRA